MSQSWHNRNDNDDEDHSPENSSSEHTVQSTRGSDQMMKMRKELDEVKNAMKGKTEKSRWHDQEDWLTLHS